MKKLSIFIGLLLCQQLYAGVIITGTRIIFPSNQNTVTVQLNNPADEPALIQTWLDDGDPLVMPEAGIIPFVVIPPVVEILPKKGQMLRLISNGAEKLPQDRESMYWFNILDIPAVSEDKINENRLNISIRSRIKLFYRPNKLMMSQAKAFESVKSNYNEKKQALYMGNSSPYYLNILNIDLINGSEKFIYSEPLIIAPFSSEVIKVKTLFIPKNINLNIINDYGATEEHQFRVEHIE